ncbi:MAG: pilus assembly protein TadG-related protein, partial [Armatimonadota bacterium]
MKRAKVRGSSLLLIAFAAFALMAVAALAVDWGFVYYVRHQLQNFVDAAALAGAQELPVAIAAKQKASENY